MRSICCLVLIAAASVFAIGQEKIIDKAEFESTAIAASANAPSYSPDKGFRMLVTTEARNSARPEFNYSTKWISERATNGSTRGIRDSTFGQKKSGGESITIGDDVYSRSDGGNWQKTAKKTNPAGPPDPPRPAPTEIISSEAEYKFLGTESFKGEMAKTYLKTERRVEANKTTGNEQRNLTTIKYWLAPDGHLMKSDFFSTTKIAENTITTKIVMEYEYDPMLTITAPEIAP